jgi:hypothetical protein
MLWRENAETRSLVVVAWVVGYGVVVCGGVMKWRTRTSC